MHTSSYHQAKREVARSESPSHLFDLIVDVLDFCIKELPTLVYALADDISSAVQCQKRGSGEDAL